jgi:ABC-type Mn2+/Zn2+ transport system ATPase subunit
VDKKMNVKVKNLRILEKATVDLSKDLVILTGENNTGKTYMAYTIYHLLNINYDELPDTLTGEKSSKNTTGAQNKEFISQSIGNHLKQTLSELFAFDSNTAESSFKDAQIHIDIPGEILKEPLSPRDFAKKFFQGNTYIAPAERSAVNIFSKELSLTKNRLFDRLLKSNGRTNEMLDLLKSRVNRYPKPIRDNLGIAEDLANLSKSKSQFGFLADELEKQILKGKINISPEGEVKYVPDDAQRLNLEVHLTASLVKCLSNIVFYLRHLAKPNDWIVIDEPELNLHPDNQRLIARFFGRLINEGFKVMISTHSDYIVREINNLIMLSKEDKETGSLIRKYGYSRNQVIKPGRVEALLFRKEKTSHGKIKAETIDVSETGFEIETIDEVVKDLNESSQDIYFTLFD